MNILLWIAQVLLALNFLGHGLLKLFMPYEDAVLAVSAFGYLADWQLKILGFLEVLGALGLIVPMFLTPFKAWISRSALAFVLLMIAAMIAHLSRDEAIYYHLVVVAFAAFVWWGRRDL